MVSVSLVGHRHSTSHSLVHKRQRFLAHVLYYTPTKYGGFEYTYQVLVSNVNEFASHLPYK